MSSLQSSVDFFRCRFSRQLHSNISLFPILVEDGRWEEFSSLLSQIGKLAILGGEHRIAAQAEELSLICRYTNDKREIRAHLQDFVNSISKSLIFSQA